MKQQREIVKEIFRTSNLFGRRDVLQWRSYIKEHTGVIKISIEDVAVYPLDPDNLVAGCKSAIDELKNMKIINNDSYDCVEIHAKSIKTSNPDNCCVIFNLEL